MVVNSNLNSNLNLHKGVTVANLIKVVMVVSHNLSLHRGDMVVNPNSNSHRDRVAMGERREPMWDHQALMLVRPTLVATDHSLIQHWS